MWKNLKKKGEHHPLSLANVTLCLLFLNCGSWFLFGATSELMSTYDSREWTPTRGRILESKMTPCDDHTKVPSCKPIIAYRYAVQGQLYTGDSLPRSYNNSMRSAETRRQLSYYLKGQEVEVFYDPQNPTSSCLEPGIVRWWVYGSLIIGTVAIGCFLQCVWLVGKSRYWSLSKLLETQSKLTIDRV
jgi:hypothetical protein